VKLIVVGGGIAGLSVAAEASAWADVLLLERDRDLATEASAQNAGMVRRMGEDPYERMLACRTHDRLVALGDGISRQTGAVLALAHDPFHLHDAVSHLRGAGIPVLPAPDLPLLHGARVQQAWFLEDERVCDAHQLAQHLAAVARANGAEIRRGAAVEALIVDDGRARGVLVDGEQLLADAVVLATGAWSAALVAKAGLRRPLFPVRRNLMQSEAHPLSHATHPWVWVDDVGAYLRPEAGGWLGSSCDEAIDFPPARSGSTGPLEAEPRAVLDARLEHLFPALGPVTWRSGWSGLRTFAPDRRPVLGWDHELQGLAWAAGLGGFGVTCGLAVGEAVSEVLRGAEVPWMDMDAVSPGRHMMRKWLIRPDGDLNHAKLVPGQVRPSQR